MLGEIISEILHIHATRETTRDISQLPERYDGNQIGIRVVEGAVIAARKV